MSFGHHRERQVKKQLEEAGWFVIRAPASLGVADLVALKLGHQPRMLEIKATSRGPYAGFPPADRTDLLNAAARAGAAAFLVWWPKRGRPVWLAPEDWPPVRVK